MTATDRRTNPYAPTITRVVERGIDLALAELAAPATQKPDGKDARDREAVEAALNHEQR